MDIPFTVIDWKDIPARTYEGKGGMVTQQAKEYHGLRIRIVEYSPGYFADHWCEKGHIVHCLKVSFESEMESGEKFSILKGLTYVVTDQMSSHRSRTDEGCRLFIVDGEFLI